MTKNAYSKKISILERLSSKLIFVLYRTDASSLFSRRSSSWESAHYPKRRSHFTRFWDGQNHTQSDPHCLIELIKAANEKDYELYISASKRLGTIAYEAPVSELALLSERMFDIFGNDNLSSENMQNRV